MLSSDLQRIKHIYDYCIEKHVTVGKAITLKSRMSIKRRFAGNGGKRAIATSEIKSNGAGSA